MRYVIGYGNELRVEDAFGFDVVSKLDSKDLTNIKILSLYQLTPEIVLDLLDADEVIFIDALYSIENKYAIACSLYEHTKDSLSLTHHISYKVIIHMLNNLYDRFPKYEVYSMLTNNFEKAGDTAKYKKSIDQVVNHLTRKLK